MNKKIIKDQTGSHALVIALVLIVVAAVGAAAWFVFFRDKDSNPLSSVGDRITQSAEEKTLRDECGKHIDDEDFCKFVGATVKWEKDGFKAEFSADAENSFTTEYDSKGNWHSKTTSAGYSSEMIHLDGTTYSKMPEGEGWYVLSADGEDSDLATSATDDFDFKDAEGNFEDPFGTFTKGGKEACGDLTCFKYSFPDKTESDGSVTPGYTIWFDDKDYLLRKIHSSNADGESTIYYSYPEIKVSKPSPIVEAPGFDGI